MQKPLKIAVAQLDIIPGRPDLNVSKILAEIEKCKELKDDVIVFSELAVPGYLLGDEWENTAFVTDCYNYNDIIRNACKGITAIWGNVDIDTVLKNEDGRIRKYNAAFIAQDREYLGTVCTHKTLMPKYREFEDERHFYSLRKEAQDQGVEIGEMLPLFEVKHHGGFVKTGIILCEDMWSDDYSIDPIKILLDKGAEVLINLSASPWTWRKNDKRHRVVRERIKNSPVPFVYANNTGVQNNGKNIFLFDGNSTIYNADGTLHKVARDYTEETIRTSLFAEDIRAQGSQPLNEENDLMQLHEGLIYGIRKFFGNFASKKVVLGLSGGIDSALSATLLAMALGPENVFAVNMPSQFNSETTKGAARQLAENLGIFYTSIPIQQSVDHTIEQIESAKFVRKDGSSEKITLKLASLNKENIQARDRGSRVLAGVASALGAVYVNNGNKTETAFGYATLYGDVNGALAPLADLYKMQIYDLGRFINKSKKVIPDTIFDIPASAELSEDQNVDEGKGDPILYPYHDKLVKAFVEYRMDPEEILRLYLEGELESAIQIPSGLLDKYFISKRDFIADLEHKWKLFKLSYFKRIQSPPIITVSKRAFGFDLRESQNGVHFTRAFLALKDKALEV